MLISLLFMWSHQLLLPHLELHWPLSSGQFSSVSQPSCATKDNFSVLKEVTSSLTHHTFSQISCLCTHVSHFLGLNFRFLKQRNCKLISFLTVLNVILPLWMCCWLNREKKSVGRRKLQESTSPHTHTNWYFKITISPCLLCLFSLKISLFLLLTNSLWAYPLASFGLVFLHIKLEWIIIKFILGPK